MELPKKCLTILVLFSLHLGLIHTDPDDTTALIWTEKLLDGSVRLRGVQGNPEIWIDHGISKFVAYGNPANMTIRRKSQRMAVGFQAPARRLYFGDVGYRELFRMTLGNYSEYTDVVSYVDVEPVYSGLSTQVRGVAVDWQSGNVYWTDMLYNWITVAQGDGFDVYRHLVTTGLDKPFGIAVYPQKGYLFWTDQGVVPKVQRAMLDGSDVTTLLADKISRPTGVAIDLAEDHLYVLDDGSDSLVKMGLDGQQPAVFEIQDPDNSNYQFINGIALYKNYVMISDQFMMNIKIYDKDLSFSRGKVDLQLALPYDLMFYDSDAQQDFQSGCPDLNCDHLCINMGNGDAKCMCSQEYNLAEDGRTCQRSSSLTMPQYIYSIGSQICATQVRKTNLDQDLHAPTEAMQCFQGELGSAEALAVDVYSEMLFFSDTEKGTINRARLEDGAVHEPHALQVGTVRGLAVDWLASHLYWADEEKAHIMVSNLDGSLPTELVSNLHKPRGLVVDPLAGYMYWSTEDAIYRAHMDGTHQEVFVGSEVHDPDGMTISYTDDRLYWADRTRSAIMSIKLDGSGRQTVLSAPGRTFRDVTVYQDYLAWTDGNNNVMFGERNADQIQNIRAIEHATEHVSHDVILHDESAQPLRETACDLDNGDCSQLCLLVPMGKTCACGLGFVLDSDGKNCVSDLKSENFLLFTDPYQRTLYQLDLLSQSVPAEVQGVSLRETRRPEVLTYNPRDGMLYWYDSAVGAVKRRVLGAPDGEEVLVVTLGSIGDVGAMIIDDDVDLLIFTDTVAKSIRGVQLKGPKTIDVLINGPVIPASLVWDKHSKFMYWAMQNEKGLAIYKGKLGTLPNKMVVVEDISSPTVKGMAVDDSVGRLYWFDDTDVYSSDLAGLDPGLEYSGDSDSPIVSLAAFDNVLFISEQNRPSILRYDLQAESFVDFTAPSFSSIQSLQIVTEGTPDIPTVTKPTTARPTPSAGQTTSPAATAHPAQASTTSATPTGNILVLAVACAVAGAVVIVVIVVAVLCVRRRRNAKKPKTIDAELKAHDNPTYMRADEVPRRPTTIVTERGASGGGPVDPAYPVKTGPPFLDSTTQQDRDLPVILPMAPPQPPPLSDTEVLVDNMADQSEVTLNMAAGENMVVSYTNEK